MDPLLLAISPQCTSSGLVSKEAEAQVMTGQGSQQGEGQHRDKCAETTW